METLRTVILRPYRRGPRFRLETWDTGRVHARGTPMLGYRLTQIGAAVPIFEGEDFSCSPLHATDSDTCLAALLGFLTLRPGDTGVEYFVSYTDAQREFCDQHAKALQRESIRRFGDK